MQGDISASPGAAVYPAHVPAMLVRLLAEDGVPAARVLRDSGVDADALLRPATRVSMTQILTACRNACELSTDSMLGARVGSQMHVAACGIYGYALLSSPSHRHVTEFVTKYDRMVSPFTKMRFGVDGRWGVWTVDMVADIEVLHPLYRFLMELKFAAMLTVMRDLYGSGNHFDRVRLQCPAPSHARAFGTLVGCEVHYGSDLNDARFDASMMEHRMAYADTITNATMRQLCDQVLTGILEQGETAESVQTYLIGQAGHFPDADAAAQALGLNGRRALQRKLEAEGTSYREIVAKVRTRLAANYLGSTNLTVEEIADRLGYSDAASFRQAFYRWTQTSPREFRRKGGGPAGL